MTNQHSANSKSWLRLDTQYRVYIALAIAAIVYVSTLKAFSPPTSILVTWMSFAGSALIMDWLIIFSAHPKSFRNITNLQDSSRTMIFILVVGASLVSLFAIVILLKSIKGSSKEEVAGYVLLVITSVVVSWFFVHTIFALRYAHLYYDTDDDHGHSKEVGGLEFPGEKSPDYLDFAYFSFVLGMTFQVSDVEISCRPMRRLALVHGLISFAFNTAIVALSINVISGMVSQ